MWTVLQNYFYLSIQPLNAQCWSKTFSILSQHKIILLSVYLTQLKLLNTQKIQARKLKLQPRQIINSCGPYDEGITPHNPMPIFINLRDFFSSTTPVLISGLIKVSLDNSAFQVKSWCLNLFLKGLVLDVFSGTTKKIRKNNLFSIN